MKIRSCRAAFALTELLVVLAILALVALLQMGATNGNRDASPAAVCQNNLRRMMQAWQMYAAENDGKLVGNDETARLSTSNLTWVLGWLDLWAPTPDNTNTLYLTVYSPLAPYLGRSAAPFKCPSDKSVSPRLGIPRVRSISMNSYMNGWGGRPYSAGYRVFTRTSEIVAPPPARAFVFIDEREESINSCYFAVEMFSFDRASPSADYIVDMPADRHSRGANLSFADGHAETWHWQDPRTMPMAGKFSLNNFTPNNVDVTRLQAASSSRAP